jgi:Nuclear transport factor 2 (NTF2) domain
MATENVNGIYSQQAHAPDPKAPDVSKEEVGWYFVERYYNTLSKSPDKLHLFFGKASQFVAGVEEEKVQVSIGQRSIDERIRELDYQDCKVRITNVDTQASVDNIVVQVIGEMSNQSAPQRKFVQTFVLAPQTNGWFVLNDIFRYILEDAEEVDVPEAATASAESKDAVVDEAEKPVESNVTLPLDAKQVSEELEEVTHEEEVAETNGVSEEPEVPEISEPVNETAFDNSAVAVEAPVVEKPAEPTPTPVPEQTKAAPKAAAPASPAKPSAPKTWAQLAAARNAGLAAGAPAPAAAAAAAQPAKPSATSATKSAPTATPAAPASLTAQSNTPVRQPSPASSNQEGSTGGWQTADHNRNKSRSGPTLDGQGRVRAYVKNVYAHVDEKELKERLSKFGELVYFDIARAKVSPLHSQTRF